MQCPQCQYENLPDSLFCSECGTKLECLCPRCGAENRLTSKFCRKCGTPLTKGEKGKREKGEKENRQSDPRTSDPALWTPPHLAERIRAEQAAMEARGATDGERKTITALFADIKGSMDLIEDLDPEEARRIVDPALQFMMDAVHRYEGYVAQSTGDGIFAFFGAPIAHEDHPHRALYAALLMQEESRRFAEKLRREKGLNFQIRVGLNTGEVVLRAVRRDDLHADYTPIGHSTSLAARMESLATPGSIVVSEHTHKLTEGYFEFRDLGEQLLSLAQQVQDPVLLVPAHVSLGATLFWLGELTSARAHLEQGLTLYGSQQYRSHAFLYGQDPGVLGFSYAAWVLWYLGYPDQALKKSHEALILVQGLSHPLSLALALNMAATLHHFRREVQATRERADAAIALSREQGFPYLLAAGTIRRGWALAVQGQGEEGIAEMRQGRAALRATGAEVLQTWSLGLLAEAYGKVGQAEEGLTALAEALAGVDKNRGRHWEAELYRLKGELLLIQSARRGGSRTAPTEAEAESCFRQAIDIARRQSAKSLELRAVMSLSRLWQQQGKKEEARKLLAEIYGWFTEGFDTPDLKDAKVLLEELEGKAKIAPGRKSKKRTGGNGEKED